MTESIRKYRHVGYVLSGVNKGMPRMVPVPEIPCAEDPFHEGDLFLGRHAYRGKLTGFPVHAVPVECCESPGSDDDLIDDCVEGGLSRTLVGYVYDAGNCISSRYVTFFLEYQESAEDVEECDDCDLGKGAWKGSFALRGGTIEVQVCCEVFESGTVFHVQFYGCLTPPACRTLVAPFGCGNPLALSGQDVLLPGGSGGDCCGCEGQNTPAFSWTIKGNCHKVALSGRHVGYRFNPDPTPGVPPEAVVAVNYCQKGEADYPRGCIPTCILHAEVTGGCMTGSYDMPEVSASETPEACTWAVTGPFPAPPCNTSVNSMAFDCERLEDGTLQLTFSIFCSLSNTGSDTVVIDEEDLETLDVTFTINMTSGETPPGCYVGTATVRVSR